MQYAEKITNLTNAFKSGPLEEGELGRFYCEGTMEVRTGDRYTSPIQDICEACQMPSERNAFLLLGHKGCGKSTELNKMSAELTAKGYHVFNIQCGRDLDLNNALYADLLILMGEALLKIADKIYYRPRKEIIDKIKTFWSTSKEESYTVDDTKGLLAETGFGAESPTFLSSILNVFASVKADLKYSEEKRTEHRRVISRRSSEWLSVLRQLSDEITEQLSGKQPIVIFEDLDKINPEDAWKVFSNYAAILTGVSFPVIYTFPIALSYDPRFTALEGYFIPKTLPVIKQRTMDGEIYQEGMDIVVEIVERRAKLDLFETGVLETLTQKTGGSLRDLFYAINASAQRSIRRDSDVVSMEDAEKALEELKTSLTRRIERRHYDFLADIYNGNHQMIEDKGMLLEMLQANAVLEYNGKRWHNVHPLVGDFLIEQGLVKS